MDRFLNQDGLQHLINYIHSDILTSQNYSFKAVVEDSLSGGAAFLATLVLKNETDPWIARYRITCSIDSKDNSLQVSDVIIGGIGGSLSYYVCKNICYDLFDIATTNHTIALTGTEVLLGIDCRKNLNKLYNIQLDIQYLYNCNILFYTTGNSSKDLLSENDLNHTNYKALPFSESGVYHDASADLEQLKESLAPVAFSGSYNDLTDKPDILAVNTYSLNENDYNLIFYIDN